MSVIAETLTSALHHTTTATGTHIIPLTIECLFSWCAVIPGSQQWDPIHRLEPWDTVQVAVLENLKETMLYEKELDEANRFEFNEDRSLLYAPYKAACVSGNVSVATEIIALIRSHGAPWVGTNDEEIMLEDAERRIPTFLFHIIKMGHYEIFDVAFPCYMVDWIEPISVGGYDDHIRNEITVACVLRCAAQGNVTWLQKLVEQHGSDSSLLQARTALSSMNALHVACQCREEMIAHTLMALQPSLLEDMDNQRRTPCHIACSTCSTELVEAMVLKRPSLLIQLDDSGDTCMHRAVIGSQLHTVRFLAQWQMRHRDHHQSSSAHDLLTAVRRSGESPLHLACSQGKSDIANALLDTDPSVLTMCERLSGWTPLHVASLLGFVRICESILRVNHSIEFVNTRALRTNCTALHYAAEKGHLAIVNLLLEYASSKTSIHEITKVVDENHQTPLWKACKHSHLGVAMVLLRANPEVCAVRDKTGTSCLKAI
eukprot:PhF_6_TR15637/c0_g1_i1/m.24276